jgi:hypothetical protein
VISTVFETGVQASGNFHTYALHPTTGPVDGLDPSVAKGPAVPAGPFQTIGRYAAVTVTPAASKQRFATQSEYCPECAVNVTA